jgi:hypothetical protein
VGGRLALRALPGFQDDIYALRDGRTRKMALDMLVLVRDDKVRGVRLDARAATGDLSDCFKLYFDPDGSQKPRFRLVYRYTPDEVQAVAIEAVAVGRRRGLEVYVTAAERIGRDS